MPVAQTGDQKKLSRIQKALLAFASLLVLNAGPAAFLAWALTKSAGSLVVTLLHMSNCYTGCDKAFWEPDNTDTLQGSGTGLNHFSITCPELYALPSNTSWPAYGTVCGCDLHGAEGPWTVLQLIQQFCTPEVVKVCQSMWSSSFGGGSEGSPYSRYGTAPGTDAPVSARGTYCEGNPQALLFMIALIASMVLMTAITLPLLGRGLFYVFTSEKNDGGNTPISSNVAALLHYGATENETRNTAVVPAGRGGESDELVASLIEP